MVRLLDTLDNARRDPDKEIHFAFELDRLFESVENDEDLSQDVRLHLDEMVGDYILPEIVDNLIDWYSNGDFQSALDGLDLLETAISDAEHDGWFNVATQYHYRRVRLRAGLQGHDAADEIEEALDYLENNHSNISYNFVLPIFETTIDNVDDLSDPVTDRWIELLERIAAMYKSSNQFNQEREYLRSQRRFKQQCCRDTTDVEQKLVESYRNEADLIEQRSKLQKADILLSGVAECAGYMSVKQKKAWKQEAFQDRRTGMEEELVELSAETLEGVDPDALAREMEQNTETIVEWFKGVKEASGSSSYALYCLALSRSLVPDANKIRLSTEEYVLSQLLHRKIYSPEAYTLSIDPSDIETIPSNYGQEGGSKMSSVGNALYQLIKEGHITLPDIFQLCWISESLSPHTEAFLTNAMLDLYDDNHVQAMFMLIPHLEAAIVDTLQSVGRPAYTIIDGGTQQQLLGGLFIAGAELFGEHYSIYLRYRYTSREGMNLRNRLAHGQLRYQNATYLNTVLTLFDILKCMIRINISTFLGQFGIPQRTISPPTYYGRDTDLTLYTDLNKQIIGYGRSTDDHTIVVIREDRHEDRTELFVDRGTINRYRIDGVGLTRCDLKDAIDDLREDHPVIPDDVNYNWLDKDSLIFHTVKDIIDEELDTPADSTPQDTVLEHAKVRGVDESTARIALSMLEDRNEIITFDIQGGEEILRTDEKIQIFNTATQVDGIGNHRAWNVASHFDSHTEFAAADDDDFQAVVDIGPELADRLANR